jgi:hypothetical protein
MQFDKYADCTRRDRQYGGYSTDGVVDNYKSGIGIFFHHVDKLKSIKATSSFNARKILFAGMHIDYLLVI